MATILNQSMSSAVMKVNEEKSVTAVFGPGEIKENEQGKVVEQSVPNVAEQGLKEDGKYLPSCDIKSMSAEDQDAIYAEGLDPNEVAKIVERSKANKGARVLAFESNEGNVMDASNEGAGANCPNPVALPQGQEQGGVDGMEGGGEDPMNLSQGQMQGSGVFAGVRMRQLSNTSIALAQGQRGDGVGEGSGTMPMTPKGKKELAKDVEAVLPPVGYFEF